MTLWTEITETIDDLIVGLGSLKTLLQQAAQTCQPYSDVKAITTANLNLRSGPNVSNRIILTIPKDGVVSLVNAEDESKVGTGTWLNVHYQENANTSHVGFVSASYLKKALSTPTYPGFPPTGRSWVGVHGFADYEWQWPTADFDTITTAKLEAVKFLSGRGFTLQDIDLLRQINPNMFLVCRLMEKVDRVITPQQFVDAVYPHIAQYYAAGVRYYEVHNEPNLRAEGFGISWRDGVEFGKWFNQVVAILRQRMPLAYFGYPGLSPYSQEEQFFADSLSVGLDADWYGLHVYWLDEPITAINEVKQFIFAYPDKPVMITEFSNPSSAVSKTEKGHQYVQFYSAMNGIDAVKASFSFVMSALNNNFPHETWAGSDIAQIVGKARTDGLLASSSTGFDSPVGTAVERASTQVWPGAWFDATGFDTYYTAVGSAYHTGADLNLNTPSFDLDKLAPVYACGSGVVTFAGVVGGTWGTLVVLRHDALLGGQVVWSRYGHVTDLRVQTGDRVERGQQIARIGNAGGKVPYHLHFDIAVTDVLERNPSDWPGMDRAALRRNYTDPKIFILSNRPEQFVELPYRGISIWHWKGSSVGTTVNFSTLLYPYVQFAPTSVNGMFVKVADGEDWQGQFDANPFLRVSGPQDVVMWGQELERRGLKLHLWAVVKGINVYNEAALLASAAKVAGVSSIILDVEPFSGFWQGTAQDAENFMTALRSAVGKMHIGISADPRTAHYNKIYPDVWGKHVNSVHPQCYWGIMKRTPDDVIGEAFSVWSGLGLPICPVLQGHDVPDLEIIQGLNKSFQLGASGVSLWRTGIIRTTTVMSIEDWYKGT